MRGNVNFSNFKWKRISVCVMYMCIYIFGPYGSVIHHDTTAYNQQPSTSIHPSIYMHRYFHTHTHTHKRVNFTKRVHLSKRDQWKSLSFSLFAFRSFGQKRYVFAFCLHKAWICAIKAVKHWIHFIRTNTSIFIISYRIHTHTHIFVTLNPLVSHPHSPSSLFYLIFLVFRSHPPSRVVYTLWYY